MTWRAATTPSRTTGRSTGTTRPLVVCVAMPMCTDFSLFAMRPRSLRLVGGFAQAKTVTPEGLSRVLSGGQ